MEYGQGSQQGGQSGQQFGQSQQSSQGGGSVVTCTVLECSYNQQEFCCANKIEVGADHPACDTFTTDGPQSSIPQGLSQVATCHVEDCSFNRSEDCQAPGITVTQHSNHADCLSYRPQF